MSWLPSLIGAGGAIAGLIGGSPSSNVQSGPTPIQNAGTLFPATVSQGYGAVSGAANPAASTLGQYGDIIQQYFMNNPGIAGATSGAGAAANMGANAAGNAYGAGNYLTSLGQGLTPYVGSILGTAFDPQNALYDRTQHLLQEQTRSSEAARGLGKSPFGAGLENKAMSDFNIDWQNAQLGRQATGAGAASGLLGTGQNLIQGGAGLQSGATNLLSASSMLPYMAYNQIGGNQLGALQGYGQQGMAATQIPQQQLQDFYQLLGLGNTMSGTQNSMFGNQLYQSGLGFGQSQAMGAGLGKSLAGLTGGAGGAGGSGSSTPATGWGMPSGGFGAWYS